jgi:hypothetical protein
MITKKKRPIRTLFFRDQIMKSSMGPAEDRTGIGFKENPP